jgi:Leucine-rich repeat (LRR) protein
MAAPHARSNSNLGGAASSLGMPSKTNPDGSFRYKAVTREVLLGICKKHFSIKALGPSISGTTRSKQFDPDEFGANIPSIQTRTESLEHYLKRATHLQLDNLKLSHTFPDPDLAAQNGERVPNDNTLSLAKALRVLYLHDNNLTRIDTLSFCANALTHLYLQCNHIARIENVHELVNLEKLYLTGNMIQVLEGFVKAEDEQQQQQQLEQSGENSGDPNDPSSSSHSQSQQPPSQPRPFYLIELHMDSQRLPPGVGLALSIPSIQALSSSLRIMSLVNNAMDSDSILPISLLSKLVNLNLSRNRIDDVALVAEMCSYLPDLTTLDLRENPISSGEGFTAVKMKVSEESTHCQQPPHRCCSCLCLSLSLLLSFPLPAGVPRPRDHV